MEVKFIKSDELYGHDYFEVTLGNDIISVSARSFSQFYYEVLMNYEDVVETEEDNESTKLEG